MAREEVYLLMEASGNRITSVKAKILRRILTKQHMREMMGLSVAVILGFSIAGGNIRDRLQGNRGDHPKGDQSQLDCSFSRFCSLFNSSNSFKLNMLPSCSQVVPSCPKLFVTSCHMSSQVIK